MTREELKIKLGITLRSTALFFASSLLYITVRGFIKGAVHGDEMPPRSEEDLELAQSIMKLFLSLGA